MSEVAAPAAPAPEAVSPATTPTSGETVSDAGSASETPTPANDTTPEVPANDNAPSEAKAKAERVAARIERAKAIEIRARQAEARARQYEEQVIAKERAIAQERAEIERFKSLIHEDPVGFLEAAKVEDMEGWLRKAVKPSDPKISALEKKLAAFEQQAKLEKEQAAARQREAEHHREMVAFVGSITKEEHPFTVARYQAHEIPHVVARVFREHGENFQRTYGRNPSAEEVRAYIERESQEWAEESYRKEVVAKIFKGEPASSPVTEPGAAQSERQNGSGHQGANGPRTLTNDHATQAATGRSQGLSKEDRRKMLVAQLEAEAQAAGRSSS